MVSNLIAWTLVFICVVGGISVLVLVSWDSPKPVEAFQYAVRLFMRALEKSQKLNIAPPQKQPVELFLKDNWRTLVLVGVLLFSLFIWPTQYRRSTNGNGQVFFRENRITGTIEKRSVYDSKWEKTGGY
jgi:hypothetical protein